MMNSDAKPPKHVWCIAHRGARDEAPENTRSAFERALAYPIDGIELDVQLSADNLPIIFHDRTLYKIARQRRRTADCTFAALRRMDWGRWFHRDFKGEPLPTLAQIVTLFGHRTRLLIEIKSHPQASSSGYRRRLAQRVMAVLNSPSRPLPAENILILSFDPEVLRHAWHITPQWRYVLNLPEKTPELIMEQSPKTLRHLWAVGSPISRLTAPLVGWAHGLGMRVFTYTCNGPRQVCKALALGVDALLTDRPGWLTQYLRQTKP